MEKQRIRTGERLMDTREGMVAMELRWGETGGRGPTKKEIRFKVSCSLLAFIVAKLTSVSRIEYARGEEEGATADETEQRDTGTEKGGEFAVPHFLFPLLLKQSHHRNSLRNSTRQPSAA